MTAIIHQYVVSITTVNGSLTDDRLLAHTVSEIEQGMPSDVLSFQIEESAERPEITGLDEHEPWSALHTMVSNLEYAASMTPEAIADNDAQQLRAIAMLSCAEIRCGKD